VKGVPDPQFEMVHRTDFISSADKFKDMDSTLAQRKDMAVSLGKEVTRLESMKDPDENDQAKLGAYKNRLVNAKKSEKQQVEMVLNAKQSFSQNGFWPRGLGPHVTISTCHAARGLGGFSFINLSRNCASVLETLGFTCYDPNAHNQKGADMSYGHTFAGSLRELIDGKPTGKVEGIKMWKMAMGDSARKSEGPLVCGAWTGNEEDEEKYNKRDKKENPFGLKGFVLVLRQPQTNGITNAQSHEADSICNRLPCLSIENSAKFSADTLSPSARVELHQQLFNGSKLVIEYWQEHAQSDIIPWERVSGAPVIDVATMKGVTFVNGQ